MKQKESVSATRAHILAAASDVVLEKGVSALTLEAVARRAGVSKGGLLYHFPNKDSLIAGMVEQLIAEFDAEIEQELQKQKKPDSWLIAYIQASLKVNPQLDQVSSALFAALANNPELLKPLQERFVGWQQQAAASAPSPEIGTLVRLAIDGLWLDGLLGFAPPDAASREQVRQLLVKLARGENLVSEGEK